MKMLNNNILCTEESGNVHMSNSGFESKGEERFKTLIVVRSSEEDIKAGDKIKVSITSGVEITVDSTEYVIINRGDVVMVL
jgi:hypothetical protein